MKKKEQQEENESEEFRRFPMYVLLSCGVIILSIGVYLTRSHRLAQGITLPGKSGQGGGQLVTLNGVSVAVIGLLLCIFPLYVYQESHQQMIFDDSLVFLSHKVSIPSLDRLGDFELQRARQGWVNFNLFLTLFKIKTPFHEIISF